MGKYKIVKLIGEGRFGICYLVYAQKEEYIFKQIKPKTMKKYKDKSIFEQQILASIEYPFIPKIIDIINRDGIYGYILEYKKGIVHRDIRLPNVIVDEKDVHLIDFGLARPIDNKKYICFEDFLYLGHLLIHLHYSSLKKTSIKSRPWYDELQLSHKELNFLKRLLGLKDVYKNIFKLEEDFLKLNII